MTTVAERVALLVIGDEVLRGDVADENTPFLARWLLTLGAELVRVVVVPDEVETIAAELNRLRAGFDALITSGGVGSTHDDVTIEAVAHAFGRKVVVHLDLERMIRDHYQERANESRLRMALVPEGAELVLGGFRWVPVVCVENVYVLPGVPWLFRACLGKLADRFGGEVPETHELYLYCSEGDIAEDLRAIAREYPGVAIGSYPRFEQVHRVKISITGRDHEQVQAALRAVEEAFAKYMAEP